MYSQISCCFESKSLTDFDVRITKTFNMSTVNSWMLILLNPKRSIIEKHRLFDKTGNGPHNF